MKTFYLFLLLCILSAKSYAVQWPIIGLLVETNGWAIDITLSTSPDLGTTVASSNLTFFNGFTGPQTNTPSTTNGLTLTVIQPGFDDAGVSNWTACPTIYGTTIVRLPGFSHNTNDVIAQNTTNVVVRVALSNFVMSNDVVTAVMNVGAICTTNGTFTNSAAYSGTVTNGSVLPWDSAKTICNWTYPTLSPTTNNTLRVRAFGFHRSGQMGRPLRGMQFIAQDQNGHAITNIETMMKLDYSLPDAVHVPEYVHDFDISSLTQGDLIRLDYVPLPWHGTTGSQMATTDGVNQWGPNYAPQSNRCDRLLTYGSSYALVATNGSTSGVVGSNSLAVAWQTPFDTMGHAMDALVKSNLIWFARSNHANSTLFLTATNGQSFYNWLGNNLTVGTAYADPPIIVTHYPTNSRTDCIIATESSTFTETGCKRYVLRDLTIAFTNNGFLGAKYDKIWIDQCTFGSNAASIFTATTNLYLTDCVISNLPTAFTVAGVTPSLIRGCSFWNTNDCRMRTYTQIGNAFLAKRSGALATRIVDTNEGGDIPQPLGPIVYCNKFMGLWINSSCPINFFQNDGCTNGGFFGQNVIENFQSTMTTHLSDLGMANQTNQTNIMIVGNTWLGGPLGVGFNDTIPVNAFKPLWLVSGNAFDHYGRSDLNITGTNIGNWAIMHAVGWLGNTDPMEKTSVEVDNTGFVGMNGSMVSLQLTNWYQFTDFEACSPNVASRNGFGNYRPLSSSPAWNQGYQPTWYLPFDIEGVCRSAIDMPGSYVSGNVKKGSFF